MIVPEGRRHAVRPSRHCHRQAPSPDPQRGLQARRRCASRGRSAAGGRSLRWGVAQRADAPQGCCSQRQRHEQLVKQQGQQDWQHGNEWAQRGSEEGIKLAHIYAGLLQSGRAHRQGHPLEDLPRHLPAPATCRTERERAATGSTAGARPSQLPRGAQAAAPRRITQRCQPAPPPTTTMLRLSLCRLPSRTASATMWASTCLSAGLQAHFSVTGSRPSVVTAIQAQTPLQEPPVLPTLEAASTAVASADRLSWRSIWLQKAGAAGGRRQRRCSSSLSATQYLFSTLSTAPPPA